MGSPNGHGEPGELLPDGVGGERDMATSLAAARPPHPAAAGSPAWPSYGGASAPAHALLATDVGSFAAPGGGQDVGVAGVCPTRRGQQHHRWTTRRARGQGVASKVAGLRCVGPSTTRCSSGWSRDIGSTPRRLVGWPRPRVSRWKESSGRNRSSTGRDMTSSATPGLPLTRNLPCRDRTRGAGRLPGAGRAGAPARRSPGSPQPAWARTAWVLGGPGGSRRPAFT